MRLESDFRFHGPRNRVWEVLFDPGVLAHAFPGVRRLERVGPEEYRGTLEVGAGPVRAGSFEIEVRVRDSDPPRSCTLEVRGEGEMGRARGTGRFVLDEPAADVTAMHYVAELELGGAVARLGRFLLEPAARALARQGLGALDRELRRRIGTREGR